MMEISRKHFCFFYKKRNIINSSWLSISTDYKLENKLQQRFHFKLEDTFAFQMKCSWVKKNLIANYY